MAKQTFTTGQVLTGAQMTSLQQTAMGGGSTTAKTVSYTLVAADAGTVVQMNSASATTITVNTALFAAGDTVQIQNIGAGVCTVTAGTATVNTSATLALKQYDAGTLYFNTTSAAFFFAVDAADGGGLTSATAAVATNQTSTSTSFTDLATAGPAVTLTTGTKALVFLSCYMENSSTTNIVQMGFAVSGATTLAAAFGRTFYIRGNSGGVALQASSVIPVTTLTAGSNTFTAKYSVNGGTGQWENRYITVIDLGS